MRNNNEDPVATLSLPSAPQYAHVDISNVRIRNEKVIILKGQQLKRYSIAVGSFTNKYNAEEYYDIFKERGCQVTLAQDDGKESFRVLIGTTDILRDAVYNGNLLSKEYILADFWIFQK